jgi:hypothetical protein
MRSNNSSSGYSDHILNMGHATYGSITHSGCYKSREKAFEHIRKTLYKISRHITHITHYPTLCVLVQFPEFIIQENGKSILGCTERTGSSQRVCVSI